MGNNTKRQTLKLWLANNTNSLSAALRNSEGQLFELRPDKNKEGRKRITDLFEAVHEEILNILTEMEVSKPIPGPDGSREEYDFDGCAYKVRRSLVRLARDGLMSTLEWLTKEFPAELAAREPWPVPKYISGNKKISARLQKSRALEVYDWLYRHRLPGNAETRKIIAAAGGDFWGSGLPRFKGETEEVIVTPDIKQMALELQLSTHSIRKYLQKFVEIGIMQALHIRYGRGGKIVYSIGSRRAYIRKDGSRGTAISLHFKNTKSMRDKLRHFSLAPNR